jgi:hypothetical protein
VNHGTPKALPPNVMASTEPGRKSARVSSVKRSERSAIQPLAASWAVQMTSPRITSMFFPPACISVLSWSKRCPVSAAPSRKTILYSPSLLSLNLSTSFPAVPVSSGAAVKTSSAPPCRPPPQPAGPSRAAPANPAPPTFKKLRRDRVLKDCLRAPSLCLMPVRTCDPSRPIPGCPWRLLPDILRSPFPCGHMVQVAHPPR